MKKLISTVLAVVILTSGINALAYQFPNGFWDVNTKYVDALNAKDYQNIIKYGEAVIDVMKNAPEGSEKKDIMISRLDAIGDAYANLGRYNDSAKAYKMLCNYATEEDPQFGGTVKGAKARALQFETVVETYVDGGGNTYYGARNEKDNGVLFGICADSVSRAKTGNESMVLTYQELGQGLLPYNERVMSEASQGGYAVEFALNCPNEGVDINRIRSYDGYLAEISSLFSKYPNVPVYLRFAAEFDVWTTMCEPEPFKTAFRYVADYFHQRNKNVAMVWSPNQTPGWNVSRDDYYPGDSYVDWIGVSLYSSMYFLGDKNQAEFNEIFFKSGVNSDPVLAVKDLVHTYGDRKPIMISELGVGHTLVATGEKMTDFALKRLREIYYYLPMVYPQIKLISYFDAFVNNGIETYDFRLSTNSTIMNEYLNITRGGRFIQDSYSNVTEVSYRPVTDGIYVEGVFEVATYGHKYKQDISKVTYLIDGKYVGMSYSIPYGTHIDATKYTGSHTLQTVVEFSDGETVTTQSVINIMSSRDIYVEISGKRISFEQNPVMYNDRVMVPLRKIFEELGATVSWDGDTKTATGKRGDKTVKVTIGQSKMYVNTTEYLLDTPPVILEGSTLVPVRAIAEGLGCDVKWQGDSGTVLITP